MSGGHFQYKQWEIGNIADEVEQLIIDNDSEELNEYGDVKGSYYSQETIDEFKKALVILRQAYIYVQRIDWLESGDDGEDIFHSRLKHDMDKLLVR
jgi:hypothetical protein